MLKNAKSVWLIICLLLIPEIVGNETQWSYGNVHIIGDSHAAFCYTNFPDNNPWNWSSLSSRYEESFFSTDNYIKIPFSIDWRQGRTMHRIGRDGINGFNIKSYGIKENDIVLLIFGAIDIGSHIFRGDEQIRQMEHRDIDEIIETLVANYIEIVLENKKQYKNITIIISACIPFAPGNKDRKEAFQKIFPGKSYEDTQVKITNKLNIKLHYYSDKNNLLFLNVNELYTNAKGYLRPELSDGTHHVNIKENRPFKEKLISIVLTEQS
jgi:hypothetical protein